jgi:hypothetical protein
MSVGPCRTFDPRASLGDDASHDGKHEGLRAAHFPSVLLARKRAKRLFGFSGLQWLKVWCISKLAIEIPLDPDIS